MLKTLIINLVILLYYTSCTPEKSEVNELPNIIYINIDDLGYKDTGFTGSSYYETPNLDKLASESMQFSQAYAAAANCAPSRACLMSGYNSPRHGIYTVENSDRGDVRTRRIVPVINNTTLPDSIYTLAEMLRDRGYLTASMGKWHLGEDPRRQGFAINIAGSHRGSPGKNGYFSPYNLENIENGPEGEYLTDRLTNEALRFLEDHQDTSFFLYLPYYTVHTPLMGKEDLVEKFRQKEGSPGQNNPVYAAMVAAMDQNVGRLLEKLDELQLTDKTVVIFTSDNGGIRSVSNQDPLRAGKGSYYEGGIRVPMLIRWPGKIAAGTLSDVPVTNLDIYPTLERLTNNLSARNFDGMDLVPLLTGEIQELPDRPLFWHFPIYLQAYNPKEDQGRDPLFRTRPGSVVRFGDWKLHEYFEDGILELYNLARGPGEQHNLAEEQPEMREKLHKMLLNWRQEVNAPVPGEENPEYDPEYEKGMVESKS
jgi:arylsulfatase A-like enzyme